MPKKTDTAITIEIDLNLSDNNSAVRVDDLIQKHCYENLREKIQVDLKSASNNLPQIQTIYQNNGMHQEKYPPGSGLVYFVDGTRGAGKSTFLRTAYQALASSEKTADTKSLAQLAYIDPSRIENNEIILLSVLKALAEKIDKKSTHHGDEPKRKDFRDTFKKLAGGLSLFAKDHHQLQHLDPELFLDLGLDHAGHSKDLRKHLHTLFDTACQMLKVDALLLAFDDADTNATHARKVLECIRCYLDTPRLVILVTGDMELYSLLIRNHFYDDLGHSKHDQGTERTKQRVRMVDHLEDQYLLKIFPIRRRLQLRPLWNLLERESDRYKLIHNTWSEARKPNEVLEEIIRRGLRIKVSSDITLYREFLLKQPLRSVLQVLSRCAEHLEKTTTLGIQSNEWVSKELDSMNKPMLSEALRESLHAMALGSLYKFGVDVDAIAASELPALIDAVFELAIRDGDLDTAAYLRPQSNEVDLKNCFAALSADVAGLCAGKPDQAILYMLAGPGSVALYGLTKPDEQKNPPTEETKQRFCSAFKKYMGIGRNEDALNWSRHATAVLPMPADENRYRAIGYGAIGINTRNKTTSGVSSLSAEINKKIKLNNNIPVIAFTRIDVSGQKERTFCSIYNTIGLMQKILQINTTNTEVLIKEQIKEILTKAYYISTVSPFFLAKGKYEEASYNNEPADYESNYEESIKKLVTQIYAWIIKTNKTRDSINPSSVLLGKIWTRLYFSLEKASDEQRKSGSGISRTMAFFALCVINAFLVEELDHHLRISIKTKAQKISIKRSNPMTASSEIFSKFKDQKISEDSTPFTFLISTCPLILGLLPNQGKDATEKSQNKDKFDSKLMLDRFQIDENILCDQDIWLHLDKCPIVGTKSEKIQEITPPEQVPVHSDLQT